MHHWPPNDNNTGEVINVRLFSGQASYTLNTHTNKIENLACYPTLSANNVWFKNMGSIFRLL